MENVGKLWTEQRECLETITQLQHVIEAESVKTKKNTAPMLSALQCVCTLRLEYIIRSRCLFEKTADMNSSEQLETRLWC